MNYPGYQIHPKYLLSDACKSITPRGLSVLSDTGIFLNLYTSSYKGGRNESFMYGYDEETM